MLHRAPGGFSLDSRVRIHGPCGDGALVGRRSPLPHRGRSPMVSPSFCSARSPTPMSERYSAKTRIAGSREEIRVFGVPQTRRRVGKTNPPRDVPGRAFCCAVLRRVAQRSADAPRGTNPIRGRGATYSAQILASTKVYAANRRSMFAAPRELRNVPECAIACAHLFPASLRDDRRPGRQQRACQQHPCDGNDAQRHLPRPQPLGDGAGAGAEHRTRGR